MKHILLISILTLLFTGSAYGQSLTEKILRESPKFSLNLGIDYQSNLQAADTYQNRQSTLFTVSPRYRLTETYTLIGRTALSQSLTQENRTDLTSTTIGITRRPIAIARIADVRPTLSLVLPTNEIQRRKDKLRGGLNLSTSAFIRTNTQLVLGGGLSARLNSHRFKTSAINGPNLQTMITPFATLGWALPKLQFIAQAAHTSAWTYAGKRRGIFAFDQSVSYIPNRKLSFTLGHNNRGSVLARDAVSSNVRLFNSKTSVIYLGALYNY